MLGRNASKTLLCHPCIHLKREPWPENEAEIAIGCCLGLFEMNCNLFFAVVTLKLWCHHLGKERSFGAEGGGHFSGVDRDNHLSWVVLMQMEPELATKTVWFSPRGKLRVFSDRDFPNSGRVLRVSLKKAGWSIFLSLKNGWSVTNSHQLIHNDDKRVHIPKYPEAGIRNLHSLRNHFVVNHWNYLVKYCFRRNGIRTLGRYQGSNPP